MTRRSNIALCQWWLTSCRFGIEATLDEVFEAPALIKHNLKDEAAIHETYVGGRCAHSSVLCYWLLR